VIADLPFLAETEQGLEQEQELRSPLARSLAQAALAHRFKRDGRFDKAGTGLAVANHLAQRFFEKKIVAQERRLQTEALLAEFQ
jgi:hypothetical protein